MLRPDGIGKYPDVDLKLGIKSSLPSVKSTLALLMMLWKSSEYPAELAYCKAAGDAIEISDNAEARLINKYQPLYSEAGISNEQFIMRVNDNQLFKSQLESLIVAFELIWRVAKVRFDNNMSVAYERTGGKRYPKTLLFTKNMDILDSLLSSDDEQYSRVLLEWVGLSITPDARFEAALLQLLVCLSEEAVYKLSDGDRDIIFNMSNVYEKLLDANEAVDINDTKEARGSLRILKSALSDRMNPFLTYSNSGGITIASGEQDRLRNYRKRVDTYLSLTNAKHIVEPELQTEAVEGTSHTPGTPNADVQRIKGGQNVILYGVPGSGKSYTIGEQYCNDESRMARLVFHPDYTYSDFIGQILPNVTEGNVSYEFTAGPFTRMLKKAYDNPRNEYYLIIEEINRGNAPAIFGEVFQLLDRDEDGWSEYGISNADIARVVYGDANQKVRIPSNMSIIGTMNTSDQNVFTLDTAFQRRWSMRMIENDLNKVTYADRTILDTEVTWRQFNVAVNSIILKKNVRVTSSEDKRLGAFFVRESDLHFDPNEDNPDATGEERRIAMLQNSRFPEKVLKYLWDDAFKFSREDVFETSQYSSLEDVVRKFRESHSNGRFAVFKEEVVTALRSEDGEE